MGSTTTSKVLEVLPDNPFKIDLHGCLSEAARARAAGEGVESLVQTVQALLADPHNPQALLGLSDILADRGQTSRRLGVLQHLVDGEPANLDGAVRLAETLRGLGQPGEALTVLERVRRLAPDQPELALACGDLHRDHGQVAAASAAYRDAAAAKGADVDIALVAASRLLELDRSGDARAATTAARQRHPGSARLAELQATAHLADGRPTEALQAASRRIDAGPGAQDRQHAFLVQARALLDLGRPRQALGACRRAREQGAAAHDVAGLTGLAYRCLGDAERALAGYNAAVTTPNVAGRVRYGRAVTLRAAGHVREALRVLEGLATDLPDDPEVQIERATCLATLDDAAAAAEARTLAARFGPASGTACLELPGTLAFDLEAGVDLAGWQQVRAKGLLGAGERIGLGFALGHGLDAHGDPEGAFAAWQEANARVRQRYVFDAPAFVRALNGIPAATAALLDRRMPEGASEAPTQPSDATPRPIFIVGMPGSGTTLVEACLARHTAVTPGGELPLLPELLGSAEFFDRYPQDLADCDAETLARLRDAYLAEAGRHAPGATWITDKLCGNVAHLGLIHRLFPESPIVRCVRDPRDVVLSCYTQWFGQGHHYAYDLRELARVTRVERDLAKVWRDMLPEGRVHDVAYAKLVTAPEASITALLQACGLPVEGACFEPWGAPRHIETASARRVLMPVTARRQGRWARYAARLDPVLEDFDLASIG